MRAFAHSQLGNTRRSRSRQLKLAGASQMRPDGIAQRPKFGLCFGQISTLTNAGMNSRKIDLRDAYNL
jgi:hypothetical protein